MNHKLKLALVSIAAMSMAAPAMYAVPAKPGLIKYATADGDSISVYLRGDEHSHFFTTSDGYMLLRGNDEKFRYAVPVGNTLKESSMLAADPGKRSVDAEALLSSFNKQSAYSVLENTASGNPRRVINRVAPEAGESTFPTKGSPHICIILVEFADNSLSYGAETFVNMFNQEGFNQGGATGSVADFFKLSSNGQFTPTLDVLGPVKLPKKMSYYGGNDWSGNDNAPEEMVIDACTLLDPEIDFSVYDTDNDGVIDNVYVVYAGYGEAQGASANTIWPHSWAVYNGAGRTKYLDGKLLDHYATSNELRGTYGTQLDGIGTFCHEFSHVMGLPDLYATSYTSSFTPGDYSLMDHGSYNNNSNTPPSHSGYERYCLGWIEPEVLEDPETVSLGCISDEGHYNDVRIIKTPKENEYFLLENRQKKGWDQYIPGHGMLIWHIDYNPSVWATNKCNNTPSHQYIDIEEADNIQSEYTRTGDPFPGTKGVTSFTDDTKPSMKTWAGTSLNAPITGIQENNGVISFLFKGGVDIFDPVVALTPDAENGIKPGSFTAHWNKVDKANGYLLSVYTRSENGSTELTYVNGFERKNVGDTDKFEVTGLTPATTYYYVVQATNGLNISAKSNEISVVTLDPTLDYKEVEALSATSISESGFTANWTALEEADGYKVTLYSQQLGNPYIVKADFKNGALPAGWTSYGTSSESSDASNAVELPSRIFRINNSYIQTSKYDDYVRSFSFWYKSLTDNPNNRIVVKGMVDNEWTVLATVSPLSPATGGTTFNLDNIPPSCTSISLTYERESGTTAIDDICLGHGGPITLMPIEGKEDLDTGNTTSYTFDGLSSETNYGYSVKAYNADYVSKPSKVIPVVTSKPSGVGNITADNEAVTVTSINKRLIVTATAATTVEIHELSGRKVVSTEMKAGNWTSPELQTGVYIVTAGKNHFKAIID